MTERYLLDSDICIYLLKDLSPALTARARDADEGSLVMSAISLAEIGLGGRTRLDEAIALDRLLGEVAVAPFDGAAARRYAALPFGRARFDRLIAAQALALGAVLVTDNETDFAAIPDLRVENWTR